MIVSELMEALSRCSPHAVVVGFMPNVEGWDESGHYHHILDSGDAQEVTDVLNKVSRVIIECDGVIR